MRLKALFREIGSMQLVGACNLAREKGVGNLVLDFNGIPAAPVAAGRFAALGKAISCLRSVDLSRIEEEDLHLAGKRVRTLPAFSELNGRLDLLRCQADEVCISRLNAETEVACRAARIAITVVPAARALR